MRNAAAQTDSRNDQMGTFHVDCTVANLSERGRSETVPHVLVDTGSDYTWLPAAVLERIGVKREKKDLTFDMANGKEIIRNIGFAFVKAGAQVPLISSRDAVRAFEKIDYEVNHQTGSHIIMRRKLPPHVHLSVPNRRELRRETLQQLIRNAG